MIFGHLLLLTWRHYRLAFKVVGVLILSRDGGKMGRKEKTVSGITIGN